MHNSRQRHEMKEGTNIRSFNFDKDPTEVMVLEEKKYKKKNDTIDIKCVVCFNQQIHASAWSKTMENATVFLFLTMRIHSQACVGWSKYTTKMSSFQGKQNC